MHYLLVSIILGIAFLDPVPAAAYSGSEDSLDSSLLFPSRRLLADTCDPACNRYKKCCDGKCLNVKTDVNNCGACGHKCRTGEVCLHGKCLCNAKARCTPGKTCCSGTCANLSRSELHCGACGQKCGRGETCFAKQCTCGGGPRCTSGLTCCWGKCLKLDSDSQNCGNCGNICPKDTTCVAGQCKSTSNTKPESEEDPLHCGALGVACNVGETCNNGVCLCGTSTSCSAAAGQICLNGECPCAEVGTVLCGGKCIETSIFQSDMNNCGSCGHKCSPGGSCILGTCFSPTYAGCTSNTECTEPRKICYERSCVECLQNSQCNQQSELKVCQISTKMCVECTADSHCGSCQLCKDSKCVPDDYNTCCPKLTGCKTYNSDCSCKTCNSDLILAGNKCCEAIEHCSFLNSACKCRRCADGYAAAGDGAVCCPKISNAESYDTLTCKPASCAGSYRLNEDKTACCQQIDNALTYDATCVASECAVGYKASEHKLACCLPSMEGCLKYSDTCLCSICDENYVNVNGICTLAQKPNCSKFAPGTFTCIKCDPGYEPSINGDCCTKIENCEAYNDDCSCKECSNCPSPDQHLGPAGGVFCNILPRSDPKVCCAYSCVFLHTTDDPYPIVFKPGSYRLTDVVVIGGGGGFGGADNAGKSAGGHGGCGGRVRSGHIDLTFVYQAIASIVVGEGGRGGQHWVSMTDATPAAGGHLGGAEGGMPGPEGLSGCGAGGGGLSGLFLDLSPSQASAVIVAGGGGGGGGAGQFDLYGNEINYAHGEYYGDGGNGCSNSGSGIPLMGLPGWNKQRGNGGSGGGGGGGFYGGFGGYLGIDQGDTVAFGGEGGTCYVDATKCTEVTMDNVDEHSVFGSFEPYNFPIMDQPNSIPPSNGRDGYVSFKFEFSSA